MIIGKKNYKKIKKAIKEAKKKNIVTLDDFEKFLDEERETFKKK